MGTLENLGIYFTIFFVQIIQLCVSTFRTALMARDEKIVNTLLAFIQSLFYILVAAQVLVNIKEDPMQVVVYVLGALVGTYIGMVIDEKLAIGQDVVTVIVDVEKGNKIVADIRDKGYAVTVLEGQGIKDKRLVLMIAINRKKEKKLMNEILKDDSTAVLLTESVSTIGGYY